MAAARAHRRRSSESRITLAKFVDPLPIPSIAKPIGAGRSGNSAKVPVLSRSLCGRSRAKLHRDLPPTRLWGYGGSVPGPTFETRSGEGVLIEWANELPRQHFLPIDHTLHGAEADKPEVRGVVHVHGAKAPPESDG